MPRLTLSRKIFLALAALLIVLLLSFAGLSIVALQRGLGSYVAEIEIRRMDWLSQLLLKHYAANGDWKKLQGNDDAWQRLQMGRLAAVLDGTSNADERRLPPWYENRGPGGAGNGPESGAENGSRQPPLPSPQLELLPRRFPPPPPLGFFPDPREAADSIFQRLGVVDAHGAHVVGAKVDPENSTIWSTSSAV